MNFRQAQAKGVAIGARQIRRGFFQLFDKRISAEVKQLFRGSIPKLLYIFFDKLGSRATQSVSKPSSERATQRSGDCGAESGCGDTNRWLRPGIGAERGHCRFTRRLALKGIAARNEQAQCECPQDTTRSGTGIKLDWIPHHSNPFVLLISREFVLGRSSLPG